jgi:uncharacterized protein (DUF433 family)
MRMNTIPAVSVYPDIQGGTPCFAGTRVPVRSLFDAIERGRSLDYFLEQFPSVTAEQAREVLRQADRLIEDTARGSHAA